MDWFPETCYWLELDKTLSGPREYYRGDIYGDSTFTQPLLKVVEVGLQVADEQCRLAGRVYDGRVVRVEGSSMWCESVGASLT